MKDTFTSINDGWKNRAELAIAQGALTNSKRPSCFPENYKSHFKRGHSAYMYTADNTHFVDFICGLGSCLFGHANTVINDAICKQVNNGLLLSMGSELEVEAAERAKELWPYIDRLRFLKTGSDACNAAIRIARTYTGKPLVLSQGYHGNGDEFVSLTPPHFGVDVNYRMAKLEEYEADGDFLFKTINLAAVIVEPIETDSSSKRIEWLHKLRDACTKAGAVLIFDEVITGMRYPKLSVANYYNIKPDITCFGKAIAGGLPLSIVGGKEEIMNAGEWFYSSTFAGEMTALAAFMAAANLVTSGKYEVEDLIKRSTWFCDAFNEIFDGKLKIEGYGTRGVLVGEDEIKHTFMQEAFKSNMLFGPSFFTNFGHIPIFDTCLHTIKQISLNMKLGKARLVGRKPTKPFAQIVRERVF